MTTERKIVMLFILSAIIIPQFSRVSASHNAGQEITGAYSQMTKSPLINQIQDPQVGNNLTLQIRDWNERTANSGLNVTVYDSDKNPISSKISNHTGHIFLQLANNSYYVSVRNGSRLVGYQEINVTKPETIAIRTWAYDLNLTIVDEEEKPLVNHEIILYDQIILQPNGKYIIATDQVGKLVDKKKTDGNGTAHFYAIWNGTYGIEDANTEIYSWHILNFQQQTQITLKPYDIAVECIDQQNNPLSDNIVFLYAQSDFYIPSTLATTPIQGGILLNLTKTDGNGMAYFNSVWNGTYSLSVVSSELVGKRTVNLQEKDLFTIKCNRTYISLGLISWLGEPLRNATVYIYNSAGHLIFRDHTDQNGDIYHDGVYLDNYTVSVEWMDTEVWSGVIDVSQIWDLTIKCLVYEVAFRFVDQFSNALPNANVVLKKIYRMTSSGRISYSGPIIELKTDETGECSIHLPAGRYEISCSQKIYSATVVLIIVGDNTETIICNIQSIIWLQTFLVIFPLICLTLVVERKKVKKPIEIKKYRNMLMKLGTLYDNGQVEYKIYRKLHEEYDSNLMELAGREMR